MGHSCRAIRLFLYPEVAKAVNYGLWNLPCPAISLPTQPLNTCALELAMDYSCHGTDSKALQYLHNQRV